MLNFEWNGKPYIGWSVADARAAGVPDHVISEALAQAGEIQERRKLRAAISAAAGDQASLLGTTSDAASLAIYGLANLVAKLATATSLAEVREAAEPFALLSEGFLAKVESGEVQLPFISKGIDTVVADIETRATAVSAALNNTGGSDA